jgi:hypothetical protein
VAKVLKFEPRSQPQQLSHVGLQYSTTLAMAQAERENPNHGHVFTCRSIDEGGPALCMTCLQTVVLPRCTSSTRKEPT